MKKIIVIVQRSGFKKLLRRTVYGIGLGSTFYNGLNFISKHRNTNKISVIVQRSERECDELFNSIGTGKTI